MIRAAGLTTAYRPKPPRNSRALAVTVAAAVLISGLVALANSACLELVIASSNEKFKLLTQVAASYGPPRVERRCVTVRVIEKASGTAERALARDWQGESDPRPHVWSPAATTWLLLLSEHRREQGLAEIVPPVAQSLIQSPLVIAMPEQMAATLRASRDRIGWHDVLALARDPEAWAGFGKPWGPFRLGKTTPLISTSGLHALISLNNAAQAEEEPVAFLQGVESSVLHYADSVRTFLANLRRADDRGEALKYVSAIAVEEKQVFDYNRGNPGSDPCDVVCELPHPKEKLVAIYPKEGTLIADHPYALLNWAEEPYRQAASDFQRHLESEPVQRFFQQQGFRDHRRQAGEGLKQPYFDPFEPRTLFSPPIPSALREMVQFWSADIRKRANALIVLDVGPSTGALVPALEATKLTLAKRAIDSAIRDLADNDVIGLRTFPTSDGRAHDEVLPLTELGVPPIELSQRLQSVQTLSGSRALYSSVRAAADRVRAGFVPHRVNAVILVSDGSNETSDSLFDLITSLRQQREDQRVLIFTVALSADAAHDLREIANESGGVFYNASDPTRIEELVRNALANL